MFCQGSSLTRSLLGACLVFVTKFGFNMVSFEPFAWEGTSWNLQSLSRDLLALKRGAGQSKKVSARLSGANYFQEMALSPQSMK